MKLTKNMSRAKFIILLIVISVLFAGGVGYFGVSKWYESSIEPKNSQSQDEIVVKIELGSTASDIAKLLETKGVIKSATAFSWYIDRNGVKDQLQAGSYRLSPSYSVADIVDIIANGRVDTRLLTIPPGLRLDEIQQVFVKDGGFDEKIVKKALEKNYQHPLLGSKPNNASLEGYIFPESLQISEDTTPEIIIQQSFDIFNSQITSNIRDGIEKQGLSLHEAVILASIVQLESSDENTQEKIAQVFLSRLELGIPLGADPTFIYAARIMGVEPSVSIDSPYNTRIHAGLPPGPISNFNFSALNAVAFPASTDFLYFVAGDDGVTRFSKTEAEHQELINTYCKVNCQTPE